MSSSSRRQTTALVSVAFVIAIAQGLPVQSSHPAQAFFPKPDSVSTAPESWPSSLLARHSRGNAGRDHSDLRTEHAPPGAHAASQAAFAFDLDSILGLGEQDPVDLTALDIDENDVINAPIPFEQTSDQWKLAMVSYLLNMKANGHRIHEIDSALLKEFKDKNIVCKVAPYRVCYSVGADGKLRPLRSAQPVNILRVYK